MNAHRHISLIALGLLIAGFAISTGDTAPAAPAFSTSVVNVATRNPSASDSGSGSASRPFKTIQRAIDTAEANNARGVATTIKVQPGVYREDIRFEPGGKTTAAPIILEGPTTNDAILSAADLWRNWAKAGTTVYSHRWPYRWGPAPVPSGWKDSGVTPIVQRRETLFVNGALQRQVLSMASLQATRSGAFFVSEPNGTVYLKPSHRVNMTRAVIEVGARERVLLADGQNNLTIRNLRFRGATTAFAPAGILNRVANVVVSNVTFGWNNWTGFEVDNGMNVKIVHSHFDHNGAMGISAQRNRNLVLEDDTNSYNNWRGARGGMTLWENGMKLSSTHGALIKNFLAIGNQAPGLWLDTDNRDVTIENSTMKHNRVDGVLLEANQGPITLKQNTVCGNGRAGIFDGRTDSVALVANRSFNNSAAQLLFSGSPFVRSVTDWQTGATTDVHSVDWTINGNTFAGSGAKQLLVGGWGVTDSPWTLMAHTMNSHNNKFIHDDTADPFWIPGSDQPGTMNNWIAASGEHGSAFSSAPIHLTCK